MLWTAEVFWEGRAGRNLFGEKVSAARGVFRMDLNEKLKNLPALPGVYIMEDADGGVIYVGKARSLKNRVRQYFHASANRDEKVSAMVRRVRDFRYILANNEVEALVLESNLIKKYRPQYNILLKDDKAYPFIKINLNEKFPKIEIARRIKPDGAKYFGPYMAGVSAKDMTELIEGAFPLRNCKLGFAKKNKNSRPCLNYHIKRCLAPCCLDTEDEYNRIVKEAVNFLSGQDKNVQKILTEKMNAAAACDDYESAIYYRDKLKILEKIVRKQVAALKKDFDLDVFGIAGNGMFSTIALIVVRGGKIVGEENFMSSDAALTAGEALGSFMRQYYAAHPLNADEIIVSEEPDDREAMEEMFAASGCGGGKAPVTGPKRSAEKRSDGESGGRAEALLPAGRGGGKATITCPKRGVRRGLTDTAVKNAAEYMRVNELRAEKKRDMTFGAMEMLKKTLDLKRLPRRIEAYDISNISGQYKVASMVVFTDGRPDNAQYRRFRIKTVEGADDFKSMNEALSRRLARLMEDSGNNDASFAAKPDLLLIDGGKGQLSAAYRAVAESGADIEIISLAKKEEEIYTLRSDKPASLPRTNLALNMLIRLRDEAHRFAISYFRKLKASSEFESRLKGIGGIGKAKTGELFRHFKTLEKIKNAAFSELCECRGIGKKDAERIIAFFKDGNEE